MPFPSQSVSFESPWRRGLGRVLLLTGCLLLPALGLSAEESIPQDLQRTLAARKALEGDEHLAPLQLGVRVENRVAVVWGPVPSTEHAQRALSLLKKVAEIQDVRDEMSIDSLLVAKPAPAFQPTAVAWEIAPQAKIRPDQLTKFEVKKISDVPDWAKSPPKKLPEPAGVTPTIAIPVIGSPATPTLQQRLAALQHNDVRCRRLKLDVKDGQVVVSGIVARWEDLNDVSRLIAHLPGVERVVLHTVRTDRQR